MIYTEQEIATMVAQKCQEVLAPLYEELHDLQVQYGMREAEQPTIDPNRDPKEAKRKYIKELKFWRTKHDDDDY